MSYLPSTIRHRSVCVAAALPYNLNYLNGELHVDDDSDCAVQSRCFGAAAARSDNSS